MARSAAAQRLEEAARRAKDKDQFRHLPPRIAAEDMREFQASTELSDANLARDREVDWLRSGVWAG